MALRPAQAVAVCAFRNSQPGEPYDIVKVTSGLDRSATI